MVVSIRELAERQHGMVSRSQMMAIGLSDRQVTSRVDNDRFVTVRRGVYSVGHRQAGQKGVWMSAVLACGPGAVLSHRSAAALWGFMDWNGPVEVLSPVTGRRRGERIDPAHFTPPLVRKSTHLGSGDVTMVDGIPVTTVARTLADLAAVLTEPQLASALDSAAIKKLLNLDDLRRVLAESRGRKGIGKLRSLLEKWHPQTVMTRSELEARFLRFLKKIGFDEPQVNVEIALCEVDFYWPDYDMIVELDGRKYHDTGRGFEEDRERTVRLELAGKRVLRLTWDMVVNQPSATRLKLFEYRKMALFNKLDLDHAREERERRIAERESEEDAWAREDGSWDEGGDTWQAA
jgi:very-short-patch-repair endonuclease